MSSDVRALLLTDVVDSTKLSEELGDDAIAALWTAHDRVARDLIGVWRGREIDKTDGLLLLFDFAADAVGYALAYHRALATLDVPLRARAGLHVGSVILRENNASDVARGAKPLEVDGIAKPIAARVMSLALGGQTLLTSEAREAVDVTELRIQSHGHWRFNGIAEPVEVFEVGGDEAPFVPPPDSAKAYRVALSEGRWLPVRQIDNNLPQEMTSLVGRKRELADVLQLLSTTRLLTLVGIGGLGKTRLGLLAATAVLGDFVDGVWFVELAPLLDGRQVPHAVATALPVKEEPGLSVLEALVKHVKDRRLLIVLDNCEHLLDACAAMVKQLLGRAPHLKVLATSREPLHVTGETTYAVPTLSLPETKSPIALAALSGYEAIRLFCDRAAAARPGFALTEDNGAAIADICRRLDGLPLALELAAAQVRALPVATIAERLKDRFRLLTGRDRTRLPRQQTLSALIDWSYELLGDRERVLLQRLSVFAGGFTLEAAESLGAGAEVGDADLLDTLIHLVEKSLVVLVRDRYRQLETVRHYAQQRLAQSGCENEVRDQHLAYYVALAEKARSELRGPTQGAWIERIDFERENFLAAHAWCDHAKAGADLGLRLVEALKLYWLNRGLLGLGYQVTVEALMRPGAQVHNSARCDATFVGGQLAYFRGHRDDAIAHLGESVAIAREIGSKVAIARALSLLGVVFLEREDHSIARGHLEEALALARGLPNKIGLALALNAMAELQRTEGKLDLAESLYEESLGIRRDLSDRDGMVIDLLNLTVIAIGRGLEGRARHTLEEAAAIAVELSSRKLGQAVLDACAGLAVFAGQAKRGACFYGASEAQIEQMGLRRETAVEIFLAPLIAQARESLGETAFEAEKNAGRTLNYEAAVADVRTWLAGGG